MTSTMSTWRSNQLSYNPIVTMTEHISVTVALTISCSFLFVNRNLRFFGMGQGLAGLTTGMKPNIFICHPQKLPLFRQNKAAD